MQPRVRSLGWGNILRRFSSQRVSVPHSERGRAKQVRVFRGSTPRLYVATVLELMSASGRERHLLTSGRAGEIGRAYVRVATRGGHVHVSR